MEPQRASSERRYKLLRKLIREEGLGNPHVDARSKGASVKLSDLASETLHEAAKLLADEATLRRRTYTQRGSLNYNVRRYLFYIPKFVETYNLYPRKEKQ